MLFSQLIVNTVSYCSWLTQEEQIEFYSLEDIDTEEEEDNLKESYHKYKKSLQLLSLESLTSTIKYSNNIDLLNSQHPEITTPPPELGLNIA